MRNHLRNGGTILAVGAMLALVPPLGAQQTPAPAPAPAPADAPTVKDPLRFSAFAVSMQAGTAGDVEIAIERWTTDQERQGLLRVLAGANFKEGGQQKLLTALQKVKPRTGYIRTPNSLGWDLRYARENMLLRL